MHDRLSCEWIPCVKPRPNTAAMLLLLMLILLQNGSSFLHQCVGQRTSIGEESRWSQMCEHSVSVVEPTVQSRVQIESTLCHDTPTFFSFPLRQGICGFLGPVMDETGV